MPPLGTREIEISAQVLERHLSGESHLRLHLLCARNGPLIGLWRVSRKPNGSPPPDLFDIGTFRLRAGSRNLWFVEEFRLDLHHEGIARRYRNLKAGSEWAQFLWQNLTHAEHHREPSLLCAQVIASLAEYDLANCILLKGFFTLARSEGYAVKEDWLSGQSASSRQKVTQVLNSPLRELKAEDETAAEHLLLSLRRWLRTHSDFE